MISYDDAESLRYKTEYVKSKHLGGAMIWELAGARLRVTDLSSTNGTFINDVHAVDAYVRGGELVRLSETTLRMDLVAGVTQVELPRATKFGRLVGASGEMRRLYPLCERLAASSVPVIIEGETGTGKEVLAESLHEMGPRAGEPFVVFDCTAVPPNLVESALFGHERGSFTGATENRRGVFEEAHGGTLLLDELGDLDLSLQAKLLRALERSEVQRVGSNRRVRVDVRVLAATRRDLDREIVSGRFRDDLFFRLAVARIELPPLRRRTRDVTVLAHHFWKHLAGRSVPFPSGFAQRLEDYSWPGNVRELYNAVARRVALGELATIETARNVSDALAQSKPASVPPPPVTARAGVPVPPAAPPVPNLDFRAPRARDDGERDVIAAVLAEDLPLTRARQRVVEEFERRYVERGLAQHGGNVRNAAAASGIARRYFQLLRARRGP